MNKLTKLKKSGRVKEPGSVSDGSSGGDARFVPSVRTGGKAGGAETSAVQAGSYDTVVQSLPLVI